MISFKNCPLCSQRMIHVSLNACEQCEWAASFARDVDKAHQELAQVKAERDALQERLTQQADWYQQRFNALRQWVNSEVRPLSEESANRYFSIVANGSHAPHEQADWKETMHGLTMRAEHAERQRDSLVAVLACLFGWEDKTYAHAVMHVENAVDNLRADFKAAEKTIESLQAQLDLAHKFHDVAVKERDYERRLNNLLGEVLAVLNGDGGHTTREYGWEESTKRALARYYEGKK